MLTEQTIQIASLNIATTGNDTTVSLRFTREADGTARHEVIEQSGRLVVTNAPPPNDPSLGPGARAMEWLLEHAPGRLARAARIGLGLGEE